ncbi:hypothetical protein GW571_15220 (plasmid) [Clavibacter capsici]|uniref:hypothetical protein n=1 Tax=Clavibacter capsici TaxID=1874630 RepID=UPI0014284E78|nr:hypothetical protein [Clavibacter capsici]QIS43573.1 hypothetical protein GW571_15220 [Clavibacter capsici]
MKRFRSGISAPVEVIHASGPVWAVDGRPLVVPTGDDVRRVVLDAAGRAAGSPALYRVTVVDGDRVTRVAVGPGGGSVADGADASLWAGPGDIAPSARAEAGPPVIALGCHPGAGTTSWARLLGVREATRDAAVDPEDRVLLVCRSVPAGLTQAKHAIRDLGRSRVGAVLVVADAPGRPIAEARREQRVVAGATHVVVAPWVPALRGAADVSPALADRVRRVTARVGRALEAATAAGEGVL